MWDLSGHTVVTDDLAKIKAGLGRMGLACDHATGWKRRPEQHTGLLVRLPASPFALSVQLVPAGRRQRASRLAGIDLPFAETALYRRDGGHVFGHEQAECAELGYTPTRDHSSVKEVVRHVAALTARVKTAP